MTEHPRYPQTKGGLTGYGMICTRGEEGEEWSGREEWGVRVTKIFRVFLLLLFCSLENLKLKIFLFFIHLIIIIVILINIILTSSSPSSSNTSCTSRYPSLTVTNPFTTTDHPQHISLFPSASPPLPHRTQQTTHRIT
ncbi:hypothetical protein E2C01_063955 [Portunus trituberculatus]|uniref:Transmembrane protein n=1 Tax=Portunus trituberculatus TaxID=210409 RepID=A0A5B7HMG7_PORTR|nr:hypothetical protein [Portunus trituberculatus]